jgi:hypothetical protein
LVPETTRPIAGTPVPAHLAVGAEHRGVAEGQFAFGLAQKWNRSVSRGDQEREGASSRFEALDL